MLEEEAAKGFYAASPGQELGWSVAITDFDGDGTIDYLFGGPTSDGPSSMRVDAGSVVVAAGARLHDGTRVVDLDTVAPSIVFHGGTADDRVGGHGWLPIGELDSAAGLELVTSTDAGDGPSDGRSASGEAWIVSQGDRDRDGYGDAEDCQPDDPNYAVSDLPSTGETSTFDQDEETFRWESVADADSYNFYRGTVVRPWVYNETCLESGLTSPEATDPAVPAAGEAYWYESTAVDPCGPGPMGSDSAGNERPEPPDCP
jgi:hypothetical protein